MVATYSIVGFLLEGVTTFIKVLFTIALPLSIVLEKPISSFFGKEVTRKRLALLISNRDWIVFVFFLAGYLILFPW